MVDNADLRELSLLGLIFIIGIVALGGIRLVLGRREAAGHRNTAATGGSASGDPARQSRRKAEGKCR